MTFLNQTTYSIIFTRCIFSQGFSNGNSVASRLTFRDCSGLVSLSIGTCTFYGMNATSGAVSALTASSLSLSGASTSFLMGNGSLNTTNYNYRKFSMMSGVTLNALQTNGNMIGTLNPSTGNVFAANEAKIGDVYTLKVYGTVTSPATMSFTIGLLGSTYTFASSTLVINVTAPYVIDIMYTITSATVFLVNAFGNVYWTNSSIAQFGQCAGYNTSGNIANSSTMTCTYTNTSASSTFSVQQMILNKM